MKAQRSNLVIRFAGDSGDGIQLMGYQFTHIAASHQYRVVTLPEYPAEIRAPKGSLAGVSSFQVNFGGDDILTPGDACDVLVVMNAAALKMALPHLKKGGLLIANSDGFNDKDLRLAGYEFSPLKNGIPLEHHLYEVPLSTLTHEALKAYTHLSRSEKERCKNMFALGLICWLFQFDLEPAEQFLQEKFHNKPELLEVNLHVLKKGYHYGEVTELLPLPIEIMRSAKVQPQSLDITGNEAIVLGLLAASRKTDLPLLYCSYPITPASDILKHLAQYLPLGVKTFQAEDEIAAITAAIGASYGGGLGVTATSGPGMALKTEALNLAVVTELPLVVIDVQRAGPSTGMPTKTEQSDLLFALYGRPGDSPIPVIAPATPIECFTMAYEACRIALEYMTPVLLLSDAFLANSTEPWNVPHLDDLPPISLRRIQEGSPFQRNEDLVRGWALPGNPNTIHRIGGLEKNPETWNVSYSPRDHETMTQIRKKKIENIAKKLPPTRIEVGPNQGKLLVLGWGSTYGTLKSVVRNLVNQGYSVAHLHLRYLNPLPSDLGSILQNFQSILIPELNTGQLSYLIQQQFLRPVISFSKVQGVPFTESEVEEKILEIYHN